MTGAHAGEPEQLRALLDSLGGAFRHPLYAALRAASNGQNAPVCAQLVWHMLHTLPRGVARHPGSAAFRSAMRAHLESSTVYLEPTRTDVAAGATWLERRGLLPDWVRWGSQGGATDAH